ncbi:tRNA preQ1(34) S-adenosylmethionine ribosyltransferase-isomerase QueA [Sulfitobacter donghicola]|uniref:S-adenosylmethionine:tRNA ribosyltransferase-isomerase n=1 Tax=Sulfitobacter donghicola DSW-25 = KCTC 12864 = JCM 14565 TaxID=1300350 RepID=A0A073IL45_9RHOB|nr:tRNA preQ1(34) S-adenosylmethionine ribosyltransferase-isomerase QueA [Sulfitobacter donghicola]KEJ90231.1 S-adenosylmethionine tRNA ribosyltransferase [Sulfitobacter donghicola DSW-25 = KCTC 12864 = JCM 14565]KIN66601.1 S-adenosylmethionine:tRNA ribosyltransferase-isomerase [Sulfitobacter donghicola DSW-25 = KCTC 12864 = JCM 14565]
MKLSDFDFDLPEELIAVRPAQPRSSARLLVAQADAIHDQHVSDLVSWLRAGDRLVLNDTRVIPARLTGARHRETGQGPVSAKIEATLLEPQADAGVWSALVKPLKKLKQGEEIVFSPELSATFEGIDQGLAYLRFNLTGEDFDTALDAAGAMPLPPYIAAKRPADSQDKTDYQTVWAKTAGAVAAPTASLHFDAALLQQLRDLGVSFTYVTLHVGAGTFLPVKVDDISDHKMHAEWGQVSAQAAQEIAQTKAEGGRVIPVGTTALRLIETAGRQGEIAPWEGDTDIFITPGFQFNVADALMTNFHLPKSTLMMLVSALMGQETIRNIYAHAVKTGYRFFSYGDASLLLPARKSD